jgi:hypothetical protein
MRAILLSLAVLALGASTASAAMPPNSASVSASTSKRGAPVALTIDLNYAMPCGNPGQTLTVQLPASMKVPPEIAPAAVRVNGVVPTTITTRGSTLRIAIATKQWIRCDVLGMGRLSVVIGAGAGLANPSSPGIYSFPVAIGRVLGAPRLRVV